MSRVYDQVNAGFLSWLKLEKGLASNTLMAYQSDVARFFEFLEMQGVSLALNEIKSTHINPFLEYLHALGLSERTQSRMLSGLRSFFQYLIIEKRIEEDPMALIEGPKLGRYLPEVLSVTEIEAILHAVDLSHPQGHRNRAMLEILYACGLRVSELINLKISNLYLEVEIVKVLGKNSKERLVPIGAEAITWLRHYLVHDRAQMAVAAGHQEYVFLNRRGKKLSRVMVFLIIQDLCAKAEIKKKISPHTFRHSFATHLVEGGASLLAVQAMLGHESIITTEIYTHLDNSYLRETLLSFHPRNQGNST